MVPTRDDFAWPEGVRAAVSISFDDGRPSNVDRAAPLLERFGLRGTFYVVPRTADRRLADWQRVAETGHEIAHHTMNHPCGGNLPFIVKSGKPALEDYDLASFERDEIVAASDALERRFGRRPATFAYPCAQVWVGRDERTASYASVVARHFVLGRSGAFHRIAARPGFSSLAMVPNVNVDRWPWDELRPLVDSAIEEGKWLIVSGHDVGDGDHHQTFRADTLEALARYLTEEAEGVWADTIEAIGRYVRDQREAPEASATT